MTVEGHMNNIPCPSSRCHLETQWFVPPDYMPVGCRHTHSCIDSFTYCNVKYCRASLSKEMQVITHAELYSCLSTVTSLPCHATVRLTASFIRKQACVLQCCKRIQRQLSLLPLCFTPMLQSDSSSSLSHALTAQLKYTWAWTVNPREIFERVHLKFTVSSPSKQTNKHIYVDTHACQCGAHIDLPQ